VLFEMERNGVLIDDFLLAQHSEELGRRLHELELQAHELAGQPFNLGSPKQLGEILFTKLGLPVVKKTATGQPSTDEDVLSQLAEDYPLPKLLLEHRSLAKLKNTYTDKLPQMVNPRTGRVHTSFSQAVAVTGRLASSEPNLQNIPIRTPEAAASAPPSSPRPATRSSRPTTRRSSCASWPTCRATPACRRLRPRRGRAPRHRRRDLRRHAARGHQRAAPLRQGDQLRPDLRHERPRPGQEPRHRARRRRQLHRPLLRPLPRRRRLHGAHPPRGQDQGYVETVFGRRLHLPDIRAQQVGRRQAAERAAINAPMQGTAADLIKKAMIATSAWLKASGVKSR
jgi:DNA polymerase-1